VSSGGPPPVAPTPTTTVKARVRQGEGERQEQRLRQQQQRHPGVALLLQSLDRHHLDVARDTSSVAAADALTAACPACCTDILRCSRWPLLHALAQASITPTASCDPFLVTLDGRVRSTVIGQLLQHHGLDSPSGHRPGCGLWHLQPHHLGCR
jgi:hypothetical protein